MSGRTGQHPERPSQIALTPPFSRAYSFSPTSPRTTTLPTASSPPFPPPRKTSANGGGRCRSWRDVPISWHPDHRPPPPPSTADDPFLRPSSSPSSVSVSFSFSFSFFSFFFSFFPLSPNFDSEMEEFEGDDC